MPTGQRAALEMLAQGLEMALRGVRALAASADLDEWIDQTRSPLGRRQHCELARTGKLGEGARKVGGKWLVKRRHLDAFIERHPGPEVDEAAERAAILAFRAPDRRWKKNRNGGGAPDRRRRRT